MRELEHLVVPESACHRPRAAPLPPPVTPPNLDGFTDDARTPERMMLQNMKVELQQLSELFQSAQDTMLMRIQADLCTIRDEILIALNTSTLITSKVGDQHVALEESPGSAETPPRAPQGRENLLDREICSLAHLPQQYDSEARRLAEPGDTFAEQPSVTDENHSKRVLSRGNTKRLASLLVNETDNLVVEGNVVQKFVRSSKFELLSISCILLNTCLMALEIQFRGMILGTKISFEGYSVSLSWVDPFFFACSVTFCVVFVIELCLRLYTLRCDARHSPWIWLDGFLVSFGIFDILTVANVLSGFGFNPSMLRVIRLVRLMRLIKTLRASKGAFHSLFLLIKSLQASCTAALWSMVVLLLMCLSVGMALNQMTAPHIEEGLPLEDRKELFKYFGTFTRTMLTMFEITLGNWAPPTRLLTDNLSELWGVLMVIYRNVFCFAVVNVMRAVFIMETTRVASSDDEVAMMNNDRCHGSLESKLQSVFELIDSDGDGALTLSEFEVAMRHEKVMRYLKTLQVEGRLLPKYLFHLLATRKDGDSEPTVNCIDFVNNVCALRGDAKSIDLNIGLWLISDIKQSIDALRTDNPRRQFS